MRRFQLFIDGEFCDARSGETYQSLNPATGEAIAEIARGGPEDVAEACQAAQIAFEGEWGAMAAADRAKILSCVADMLLEQTEQFAQMETADVGKPITEARNIDVPVAAAYLKWYSEMTTATLGQTVPLSTTEQVDWTMYEPYGVIGGIVPWNFPLFLAMLKIGPALAMGNSIVLKPASITPMTTLAICELFAEAGLPAGALNVVAGPGPTVGEAIVTNPHVRMVSFTGSTDVGRRVMELAARNITDTSMELGGKSPNIIFADADFDQAVAGAVFGLLLNNGQNCIAGSRLLVQKPIYDELVSAVAQKMASLKLGDPTEDDTQLGAIVSATQLEKVLGYIQIGKSEGAAVISGGKQPEGPEFQHGLFVEPTLLADVSNDMRVAREEIFGPVLVAIPFDDEDDAVRIANDTDYGLGSGVFTTDTSRARRMVHALKSGTVYVNTYNQIYPQAPFPGWNGSGNGVERGLAGLYNYVRIKNVIQDISGKPIGWF
ncbi:MAG: aldehyde dehydrogenase [candidate division WS1 bacterium]|mgnify:CR=1 FL=1|jgi:acyl-CoA reductase-like NAD-dependent aldehyde dehydrogenase|nr:aldehyde dehydrogenase [candidate division WS1 bacterium]